MQRVSRFLAGVLLILAAARVDHSSGSRRRVCSREAERRTVSYLTSHLQPVYQPYLTLCQGSYRLCSTYRTTYRVVQRQAYRQLSQPTTSTCCPGWRRATGLGCNLAVCQPPCQNGGRCDLPNRCACPSGWTGRCCETDVDECAGIGHGCSQACLNGAGSFRCGCWPGYALQADGRTCRPPARPTGAPAAAPSPAGTSEPKMQHEVEELKRRMAVLEDRVQRALAPFLKLELAGPEEGQLLSDPLGLLLHALRQLDRIESLSEQISFLEERLETCSCKNGR